MDLNYIGRHKYDVNLNCGKRYIDMIPKMPLLEKKQKGKTGES